MQKLVRMFTHQKSAKQLDNEAPSTFAGGSSSARAANARAASERALALQKKIAQAAARAPPEERAVVDSQWVKCGGQALDSMLADTDLIDAQYLVALGEAGGVVPSWQECPREAFVSAHNLWQLRCWGFINLPVLVLSYPWLDREHPDRLGEQLKRLVGVLRAFVAKAKEYGRHATVGVLWEYRCTDPNRAPSHCL
jgi:hypothetical protein